MTPARYGPVCSIIVAPLDHDIRVFAAKLVPHARLEKPLELCSGIRSNDMCLDTTQSRYETTPVSRS